MNHARHPFLWLLLLTALLSCARAHEVAAIPSPAGPGAMGSSPVKAPDGSAYLSWLEPAGGEAWAMKFSRLDAASSNWGEPRTIVQGENLFINWADFPVLAAQPGHLTAGWFVNNPAGSGHGHHDQTYQGWHSSSQDGGATWSSPQPITRESKSVEFIAYQPLHDGRLLAAWLDGRARATGQDRQELYARILGEAGPDQLVDGLVCDCCQLSMVPTADGGAWLAYRGRTPDEIRDMRLARYDGNNWKPPAGLHPDGWKINACPVNGPQLAVDGERIGAAWFTGADNQPRVLALMSDNAGRTFGPVQRIDLGRPHGRVDSVMLPDGRLVISWLEMTGLADGKEGGIYLCTLSPGGRVTKPQLIAPSSTARTSGFPRMILLTGNQLLLSYTQDTKPSRVVTLRVGLQ